MIEVIEVREHYETTLETTQIEVVELGVDVQTVLAYPEVELVEQGIIVVQTGEAGGIAPVLRTFTSGVPSPMLLHTVQAPTLLAGAELDVRTPFNGAGAQLSIGQPGQPGRFMSASENDPAFAAQYEVFPNLELAPGEGIYLFITPGAGTTQGAGVVILNLVPL
ncbi:hypothetical protein [Meiothermus taiwanensis]|uniref:Uncharacterized protein n=1 Tax=Meiothermus taiwanensis WR-220 TaxID=1339250 RepID=A0ABM6WGS3_9DEIN|nr:hypothetical protein [Meiothermus taiwanensis]AWR86264.1 hypothetical protein Mtai_v1c10200 [Meiothermus taiwanensis WR-220]